MGTHNLTIVIKDGNPVVAQYGQWDGYPSGQGLTILEFLRTANIVRFKKKLKKCRFSNKWDHTKMNNFLNSIGSPNGWMSQDQAVLYKEKYPYLSRDIAAEILEMIYNSTDRTIMLNNSYDFAADGLSCEWAYVVDLDKNTFEVYKGCNKTPLTEDERFYGTDAGYEGDYTPVKCIAIFDIYKLPSNELFLKLEENDDNEYEI